jgi:hypothetical protein
MEKKEKKYALIQIPIEVHEELKKYCDIVDGLINVITLGRGKDIAGWIAKKLGYASCGCEERRIWLNELLNCKEGIKL